MDKITAEEVNTGKSVCPYIFHHDTTVGLWAIDQNPDSVGIEWIRANAFQITEVYTCPLCDY